jgi:hypothetical protein
MRLIGLNDSVNLDSLTLESAWLEGGLALLRVVADPVSQAMLAGVKVRVLTLLFFFDFVE